MKNIFRRLDRIFWDFGWFLMWWVGGVALLILVVVSFGGSDLRSLSVTEFISAYPRTIGFIFLVPTIIIIGYAIYDRNTPLERSLREQKAKSQAAMKRNWARRDARLEAERTGKIPKRDETPSVAEVKVQAKKTSEPVLTQETARTAFDIYEQSEEVVQTEKLPTPVKPQEVEVYKKKEVAPATAVKVPAKKQRRPERTPTPVFQKVEGQGTWPPSNDGWQKGSHKERRSAKRRWRS